MKIICQRFHIKDFILRILHREKALSKKPPALTKSTNIDIWVAGTSNHLFVIRGSSTETKF